MSAIPSATNGNAQLIICLENATMSLLPGHRLGKYEVLARIGAGGMGAVYRARDTRLQRTVALKLLSSEGPDALDRLLDEARAAAGLNHPHICTVYEVSES